MQNWTEQQSWLIKCHVLNALDAALTLYAVSKGVEEANPVMAWTLAISPLLFVFVKFAVFTVAIHFLARNRPCCLPPIAALFGIVVLWHVGFWIIF